MAKKKIDWEETRKLKEALFKAENEIQRLSAVKSDFVSIVSHELRTPLTSIKESVSLVLDGIAGPVRKDQEKFLKIAQNNIDRLANIITDILDFSKLDAGRIKIYKRKSDINTVIKDVCAALEGRAAKKRIKIKLELSKKMGRFDFDTDRIGQALRNLVSNAIKFNRINGTITVKTQKKRVKGKNMALVCVEDTGVGISDSEKKNLFMYFSPLDSSMTRNYPGLGLGLTICKRVIDFHGGGIRLESEKGVGSKFIFTLPVD